MDQKRKQADAYRKMNVLTASRENLLLMLFDGAIRFLKQAIQATNENDIAQKNLYIGKVMDIVTELNATLKKHENEQLAIQLESLYQFVQERLLTGSIGKDSKKLEEALEVLKTLRSAWDQAIKSLKAEGEKND